MAKPVFAPAEFLATLECWQQHASPSAHLHFISVERYPLNHEDLRRALALWPQLSTQAQALLAAYPPVLSHSPNQGYFRLSLPGNVQLTLIFADATEAFKSIQAAISWRDINAAAAAFIAGHPKLGRLMHGF